VTATRSGLLRPVQTALNRAGVQGRWATDRSKDSSRRRPILYGPHLTLMLGRGGYRMYRQHLKPQGNPRAIYLSFVPEQDQIENSVAFVPGPLLFELLSAYTERLAQEGRLSEE